MLQEIRRGLIRYWRWTTGGSKWRLAAGVGGPILALLIVIGAASGGGSDKPVIDSGRTAPAVDAGPPTRIAVSPASSAAISTSVPAIVSPVATATGQARPTLETAPAAAQPTSVAATNQPASALPGTSATATPPPPAPPAPPAAAGASCGVERWPVKTLSDQDAGQVNFSPVPSTVAALRALAKPASLPQARRIAPTELTTFSVQARVREFKLEDDRDIHVVINTPGNAAESMIVELVDVGCSGAVASSQAEAMRTARQVFISLCGQPTPSSFKSCTATVQVVGVGFFDELHGQTGVAPNGIELHPVLGITALLVPSGPPQPTATPQPPSQGNCSPSYPDVCIPPPPPDLDCKDVPYRRFRVLPPDPHRFDADHDGIGCES